MVSVDVKPNVSVSFSVMFLSGWGGAMGEGEGLAAASTADVYCFDRISLVGGTERGSGCSTGRRGWSPPSKKKKNHHGLL